MQRAGKGRKEAASQDHWSEEAKLIVKAHLKRSGYTYKDLAERFKLIGIDETEANIRNKLSRGTFSAAFFLQCLALVGVNHISFGKEVEWFSHIGEERERAQKQDTSESI